MEFSEHHQNQNDRPKLELERPAYRWRIRHLFYATTFYASGIALGPTTIWATTLWLLISFFALRKRDGLSAIKLLLWVALGVLFVSAMLPNVHVHRTPRAETVCQNNLRQIALAIHSYESDHGNLPESRVLGPNQKPLHSWRVLILPYLEEDLLYEQYRFDEPWDGPNNRKLHNQMPDVFKCPTCDVRVHTTYKMVRGMGTAFVDGQSKKFSDIKDGTAQTGLLIEDAGNPVHWMQPTDLTLEEAVKVFSNTNLDDVPHYEDDLYSKLSLGFSTVLMDGQVGSIGCHCDQDEIRKLFGDDNGPPEFAKLITLSDRVKYGALIAAIVYVIHWLIPIVLILRKPRVPVDQEPEKA